MPPELNLKRAVFVLGKIDEILAWDKGRLHERDLRFVDLGRYLCEVRAGQYWRLEKMKSFDNFLEMLGTDKSRGYCLEMICRDFAPAANREQFHRHRPRLWDRRPWFRGTDWDTCPSTTPKASGAYSRPGLKVLANGLPGLKSKETPSG